MGGWTLRVVLGLCAVACGLGVASSDNKKERSY
jgi:hypothetical protein